jgi:glycine hydroxymethyltransferase
MPSALAGDCSNAVLELVSGGTDTHLMLVDLRETGLSQAKTMQQRLDDVNITCNKNGIPYDPENLL